MNKRQKDFLLKLADLCEKYNAGFAYTIDDDGIHITVDGEEVYVGFIDFDMERPYLNSFIKELRVFAGSSATSK
jgi:hypothetical protein